MATTVFIWNNNMVLAAPRKRGQKEASWREKQFGYFVVGHASLHISSVWPPVGDQAPYHDGKDLYVSWWPRSSGAGTRAAEARGSLFSDMRGEKDNAPDHIIRITGLDEAKMKTEWDKIRSKAEAHYRFNVKNCSTIVARVLRAGKSWTDTNVWYGHSPLWTPLKAKRLAFSMGGTELSWVALLQEMHDAGAITASLHMQYGKLTKRSTRHGNTATPAKNSNAWDKTHGLAHWYTRT